MAHNTELTSTDAADHNLPATYAFTPTAAYQDNVLVGTNSSEESAVRIQIDPAESTLTHAVLGELARDFVRGNKVAIIFQNDKGNDDVAHVGERHHASAAKLVLDWVDDLYQICIQIEWQDFDLAQQMPTTLMRLIPLRRVWQIEAGVLEDSGVVSTFAYWLGGRKGKLQRLAMT